MAKYPAFQTSNSMAPAEFAKGMPIAVSLGVANIPKLVQLTQEEMSGIISFVQGAWIDNSLNPELLVISIPILGQIIRFPRFSQGTVPIYSINPFEAMFQSAQAEITIPVILLNMPTPHAIWAAV